MMAPERSLPDVDAAVQEIDPTAAPPGYELLVEHKPPGLVRRYFQTQEHVLGLLFGGVRTWGLEHRDAMPRPRFYRLARLTGALAQPFLDRALRDLRFPVQLRRRLELLGPTYIKLGQVLSLREDILPREITDELKNLLDRLPAVPLRRLEQIMEKDLERPVGAMFSWIDPVPLGSASIGQTHRARTLAGDDVVVKVVKPGNRELLRRDTILLNLLGRFLQTFLERFQPQKVLREFTDYTQRELDLRREADNAETFAANFSDMPDVVFPKIHREFSGRDVLCMEFLDGLKPTSPDAQSLTEPERDKLIDLGAASIIRMLYRDGFFHADLHPGNLLVLPGSRIGFIDLGMVGRFSDELRRTLMYYYFCLVTGDAENAARYLAMVAQPLRGGDPVGFRREVEDICRRWAQNANFEGFSLAQLIMQSVAQGAHFRMYFPVELVLMVKALVTFEGVGQILKPGFDVAAISQKHVNSILIHQFSPWRLAKESLRGAPELVDALVKAPLLVTEGLRMIEQATRRPQENPFAGLIPTLLAGFCLVGGAILVAFKGPWPAWALLFTVALVLVLRRW